MKKFIIKDNITSIVVTKEEFEDIINKIGAQYDGHNAQSGQKMTAEDIEKLKQAGIIPMVMRGTKTQFIFDMLEVETQCLCVCIQGFGKKFQEVLEKFQKKAEKDLERAKDAETKN